MTIKLELTEQDIQILSAALGEIPFKLAAPLVDKLNKQIAEQQTTSQPETK
jgi:hypothetical protein